MNFNPRTPCGVRRRAMGATPVMGSISIHAPLAGCDQAHHPHIPTSGAISIHAPLAGCDNRRAAPHDAATRDFNPRTPCGVRLVIPERDTAGTIISIHAPLAGCDDELVGVRLGRLLISIHAPLAGCDTAGRRCKGWISSFQSTHPLRGATMIAGQAGPHKFYFNPRTPCGVRQQKRTKKCGTFAQKV